MILCQHGLPTPDFAVLDSSRAPAPELDYPLIVKPKNESVSFGLRIVHSEQELRDAAGTTLRTGRLDFDVPAPARAILDAIAREDLEFEEIVAER